jgi:hypothetical protein
MYKDKIKQALNEELSSSDVDKKIEKSLDSRELKNKVEAIVKDHLKNNKELEDQVVDITKNVLTQLYKTLWTKRGFWKSALKNQSA